MTDTPRWFDRTFAFPYPAEMLPALLIRLRDAPARLDDTMRGQPFDRRTANAHGGWSAQEHAGHLADLEPLWLARLEDFLGGRDQLTPADLTNRRTTEANHNGRPLPAIFRDFADARAQLLLRVDAATAAQRAHRLLHPRMQVPMTLVDHLYFVAEHDDHHMARIRYLLTEDPS